MTAPRYPHRETFRVTVTQDHVTRADEQLQEYTFRLSQRCPIAQAIAEKFHIPTDAVSVSGTRVLIGPPLNQPAYGDTQERYYLSTAGQRIMNDYDSQKRRPLLNLPKTITLSKQYPGY